MAGRSGPARVGAQQLCPTSAHQRLRDLTRYRRTLVENQGSERRRLIKLLKAADIKLAGVISDIFGVSGRAILRALIEGGHSAAEMSKLLVCIYHGSPATPRTVSSARTISTSVTPNAPRYLRRLQDLSFSVILQAPS